MHVHINSKDPGRILESHLIDILAILLVRTKTRDRPGESEGEPALLSEATLSAQAQNFNARTQHNRNRKKNPAFDLVTNDVVDRKGKR